MKTDSISFLLNGEEVEIDFSGESSVSPLTTVLQYLRECRKLTGTKEGCGQGDCGACTVVIGELIGDRTHYASFLSCLLFLPFLDGKEVITVEGLVKGSELHPVQTAMIENDASQCGFCTPGIVMSIFALCRNRTDGADVVRDDLQRALVGNLCRCTGYSSIIDAASSVLGNTSCGEESVRSLVSEQFFSRQSSAIGRSKRLETPEVVYCIPRTLDAAMEILVGDERSMVINGGTDCALKILEKSSQTRLTLVDISAIREISGIENSDGKVRIGAGVTLEKLRKHCKDLLPALYDCLQVFGSEQIRNKATIGGNIGNASPVGDILPVLMAHNASVEILGSQGSRKEPLEHFITGYRATTLQKGELIVSITLPRPAKDVLIRWYKISNRRNLDISTVNAGFRIGHKGAVITDIRLFFGGMDYMVRRATYAEKRLKGTAWSRENFEDAARLVSESFTPVSDVRSSAESRQVMARNLLLKFWSETDSLFRNEEKHHAGQ